MSTRILRPSKTRGAQRASAHKLIAKTAEDMTGAVYEKLMQKNEWYAQWQARFPDLTGSALQRKFQKLMAPGYLEQARATLAGMLRDPRYSHLHEQIAEALILDNGFTREPRRTGFTLN